MSAARHTGAGTWIYATMPICYLKVLPSLNAIFLARVISYSISVNVTKIDLKAIGHQKQIKERIVTVKNLVG